MIFITLGSQKFQFNRLLIEIDKLIDRGCIKEEVFAQIGYSDYCPKNFKFKKFLDRNEFSQLIDSSDILITHGGTGAIINGVKKNKKVIAAPRLKKFGEHVDDHQIEIVKQFSELNLISYVESMKDFEKRLNKIRGEKFNPYVSNTDIIIESINKFINN